MIDPAIARLTDDIALRGAEIAHWKTPGFIPAHNDVRTADIPRRADNALSVAAADESRFVTLDQSERRAYTQAGDFVLTNGRLTTRQGTAVLGYAPAQRIMSPLRINQLDVSLGRVHNVRIERDGSLAYDRILIDPKTTLRRYERIIVGTLALARFPAGSNPIRYGTFERAPLGIEPYLGRPGDGNFTALSLQSRSTGELDINRALAHLHDAYQQLDAVAAARHAAHSSAKIAMDLVK